MARRPFIIPSDHIIGFKLWLYWLGYVEKKLENGAITYKSKLCRLNYVWIGPNNEVNHTVKKLVQEYIGYATEQ